jgi:DNA-binding GntR family transcriptional regulator
LPAESGIEMRLTPVCHAVAIATTAEEERLRLSVDRKVLRLERLRYAGGRIRTFERSVLPLHRLPGIQVDRAKHLTLPEIAEEFALELGKATECLSIACAPPEIAHQLEIGHTQHLLQIDRTTTTVDEVPIEWCVIYAMEMSS